MMRELKRQLQLANEKKTAKKRRFEQQLIEEQKKIEERRRQNRQMKEKKERNERLYNMEKEFMVYSDEVSLSWVNGSIGEHILVLDYICYNTTI